MTYLPTPIVTEDADILFARHPDLVPFFSGSHVMIVGAGGFLCSYFCDLLHALNEKIDGAPVKVTAIDVSEESLSRRLSYLRGDKNIRLLQQDVTQPFEIPDDVTDIIYGAGIASPSFYRRFPLETIDANTLGLRMMLTTARGLPSLRNFLYLSSSEIYGDPAPDQIPTPETYNGNVSCTGPRACYDESKRLGETYCGIFLQQDAIPINIIRPFNVYGPGQRLDDLRIIPDLMQAALAGGPLILFSDGSPTRSFCYIRDFATGMFKVMARCQAGGIFNLGNDHEVSIREVAQQLAAVATTPPLQVTFRESADKDYLTDNPNRRCPDISRVKQATGWAPEVALEEGLRRTLISYRQQDAAAAGVAAKKVPTP